MASHVEPAATKDELISGDGQLKDPSLARRGKLRAPRAGSLLATAAALAFGITIAVTTAGVTLAYLNSSSTVATAGNVTAGTSGLNLQYGSGTAASSITIPATVFQNMLPGDIVGIPISVINTGEVPQTLAASVTAGSAWETRLAAGACPATAIAGAALNTTPTGSTLIAVGATQAMCLQLVLPSGAAAASEGTSITYVVTIDGTQSAS